jgi:hypothetical protein
MEDLYNHIKNARPHLVNNSLNTYVNVLKSLFKAVFGKDVPMDYHKFIDEYQKVITYLENVKFNVRKTILSALVVISNENIDVQKLFRIQMIKDVEEYNKLQSTNKMTDRQKEAWCSWNDILKIVEKLKTKFYYVFKEKHPTNEELYNLQKYVILCCYTMIPPRRAMDFTTMLTSGYNQLTENYYHKANFYFNKYKTSKYTHLQIEKIPRCLETILKKWIALRPNTKLLFTDIKGNELNSCGMTKILNSIFEPKNISVNMLRHIFITEKAQPLILKLEETAKSMAHSTNIQKLYVKFD